MSEHQNDIPDADLPAPTPAVVVGGRARRQRLPRDGPVVAVLWTVLVLGGAYLLTTLALDVGLKPWLRRRAETTILTEAGLDSMSNEVPARLPGSSSSQSPGGPALTIQDGLEWEVPSPEGRRLLRTDAATLCLLYEAWRVPPGRGNPPETSYGPALEWLGRVNRQDAKGSDPQVFAPTFLEGLKSNLQAVRDDFFPKLLVQLDGANYRLVYIDELAELLLKRPEDRARLMPLIRLFYDRYRRDGAVFSLRVVTGAIQWWTSYAFMVGVIILVLRMPGIIREWLVYRKFTDWLRTRDASAALPWQPETAAGRRTAVGQLLASAAAAVQMSAETSEVKRSLRTDVERLANQVRRRFALVSFCRWCIPCLGFLGTVVGLSETMMGADGLITSTQKDAAVQEITLKLGYKFDTTGVALVLSIALTLALQLIYGWAEGCVESTEDGLCEFLDSRAPQAAVPVARVGVARRALRWVAVLVVAVLLIAGSPLGEHPGARPLRPLRRAILVAGSLLIERLRPPSAAAPGFLSVTLKLPDDYASGAPAGEQISVWDQGRRIKLGQPLRLPVGTRQMEVKWSRGDQQDQRTIDVPLVEGGPREVELALPDDFAQENVDVRLTPSHVQVKFTPPEAGKIENGQVKLRLSRRATLRLHAEAVGFQPQDLEVSLSQLWKQSKGKAPLTFNAALASRLVEGPSLWQNWLGMEMRRCKLPDGRVFYIAATELTREQYRNVMKADPSRFKEAPDLSSQPVESVSWNNAARFCDLLNQIEGFPRSYDATTHAPSGAVGYHLPTAEEWRFACFGGVPERSARWGFGEDPEMASEFAWLNKESKSPQPVKRKKANSLSLFDMHGNVWEWLEDRLTQGPDAGKHRIQGGSWASRFDLAAASASDVLTLDPSADHWDDAFSTDLGFRVALSPPAPQ